MSTSVHYIDLYLSLFGLFLLGFFLEMGDLFKKTSEHSFNINRSVLLLLCQSLERLKKKWNCEISSAGILVAQEAISIDITSVLGKKVV